jgi:hypothetical protein
MSNHESVYEGTLHWPVRITLHGITCRAPAGESLPPWGLSEEDPPPANPCDQVLVSTGSVFLPGRDTDLGDIRDAIEKHANESHGGLV